MTDKKIEHTMENIEKECEYKEQPNDFGHTCPLINTNYNTYMNNNIPLYGGYTGMPHAQCCMNAGEMYNYGYTDPDFDGDMGYEHARVKDWYEEFESDLEDLMDESSDDYDEFESRREAKQPWFFWPQFCYFNPYKR